MCTNACYFFWFEDQLSSLFITSFASRLYLNGWLLTRLGDPIRNWLAQHSLIIFKHPAQNLYSSCNWVRTWNYNMWIVAFFTALTQPAQPGPVENQPQKLHSLCQLWPKMVHTLRPNPYCPNHLNIINSRAFSSIVLVIYNFFFFFLITEKMSQIHYVTIKLFFFFF